VVGNLPSPAGEGETIFDIIMVYCDTTTVFTTAIADKIFTVN